MNGLYIESTTIELLLRVKFKAERSVGGSDNGSTAEEATTVYGILLIPGSGLSQSVNSCREDTHVTNTALPISDLFEGL